MVARALIFDVDGTIAETEEVHRQAFNETFAEEAVAQDWPDPHRDWVWDRETYGRLLRTTGGKERIAAYLQEDLCVSADALRARIAQIHAAKTRRFTDLIASGSLSARPGIVELANAARAKGLALAIATTTSRPNVDAVAEACFGVPSDKFFDVIAAGDEVAKKKPAPDVYLLALKRLGLSSEQCWALEDSENGLRAAKAAGLRCVVCPSMYTAAEPHDAADVRVQSFLEINWSVL